MERGKLGRRIKAFRKLKGYTQAGLAKKLDMPIMNLGDVERGKQQATDELIGQIADQLHISRRELQDEASRDRMDE
ncbi:helix-turn-helix domain-containing protein [Lentibacillus salicampi]|uniref:XRE family transcriptional regulator n=1 Tax=Lentibacillus salicampi TaxID=175306 RepID=A0A4Y9AC25_9BACI|nr:helix-turn-helix transcriptional regulator [Lentibacillus salicampi]TFJ92975.1 XRE family transcriptional regulator [Lentibacillus salicampi]